jgi:hypothetical protein
VALALPAHRVATPALERLTGGASGTVLGAGATAAWVDLGGFVLAVTTREVPLLPNAVALTADGGALAPVGPGGTARCSPGRVELPGLTVGWDPSDPPAWDPTVPAAGVAAREVGRRGEAVLGALGIRPAPDPGAMVRALAGMGMATAVEPAGASGLELLLRAVLERDPAPAAGAAALLLGRGPGLTPEGDDLLAAVAAAVATLGPAAGLPGPFLAAMLAALVPSRTPAAGPGAGDGEDRRRAGGLAGRTTALAATLLELAARGQVAEPAGRLLDLGPAGERDWPAALRRLERLGHGSGRAYAAGIGAAALLLAAGGRLG